MGISLVEIELLLGLSGGRDKLGTRYIFVFLPEWGYSECVFGDYAYSMEIWKGSMNPKDGSTPIVFDNTDMSIYKRQADNTWKIWRAMYNSNAPTNQ